MSVERESGRLVRGPDGVLYDVAGQRCEPVPSDDIDLSPAREAKTSAIQGLADHDAGSFTIVPEDHAAGTFTIVPEDSRAGTFTIVPDDHAAGAFTIQPGDSNPTAQV